MILAHDLPIAVLEVESAINQDLKALIPKREFDSSYLVAMIRAQEQTILGQVATAAHGTKKLDSRVLEEIPIPFPEIEEQRRIASILDKADSIRAKRRQVLDHLDALTQSIFHDMFGRLEPDRRLGEVACIQGGLQVTSRRSKLPRRVPYLRVANVYRSKIDLAEIKTMGVTDSELERTRLIPGDLLFVEGHANGDEVGRAAVYCGGVDTCVHQNHLIRARVDSDILDPLFAEAWFNTDAGADHFRRAGHTTSGLHTISASTVKAAPLLVPNIDLQRAFRGRVAAVSERRSAMNRDLEKVDELFASLQSRAFTGEL